jgi:hypothetical protein
MNTRKVRSSLLLALAAGAIATACTTEAEPTTTVSVPTSGSAETTTTDAVSTTTSPPTSSVPTTTTTTTTSTTVPPEPVPIVVATRFCTPGWSIGQDWFSQYETGEPPVVGGEHYQVVRVGDPTTTAVGSAPVDTCDIYEPPLRTVEMTPPFVGSYGEITQVAVQTDGDVVPYPVELLGNTSPTYIDATRSLMQEAGIADATVYLAQVIRTDLEGDGVDEVIVSARADPLQGYMGEAGAYSILYVRKVIEGEVATSILENSFIADGEDPTYVDAFAVAAVADLNLDGTMEIVVDGSYWEGTYVLVYQWQGADLGFVNVMGCGCGL